MEFESHNTSCNNSKCSLLNTPMKGAVDFSHTQRNKTRHAELIHRCLLYIFDPKLLTRYKNSHTVTFYATVLG